MFAELDGAVLETQAPAGWRFQRGVKPFTKTLEIDRAAGLSLFQAGERFGSSLVLTVQGVSEEIKALTILGTGPSQNPNTLRMQVADRRWTWPYKYVARSYNVPRKSPNNRRKVAEFAGNSNLPTDIVAGLREAVDDKDYAEYSLNGGKRWTAKAIIKDVMDLVVGASNWKQSADLPAPTQTVENFVLNMQGDTAIAAMFAELGGGIDVWVDKAGTAILYSPQDGSEIPEVGLGTATTTRAEQGEAKLAIQGRPLHELQDNRKVRPSKFVILFERLVEARIDFFEGDDAVASTRTRADPIVRPTAFNVFPSPEDGVVPSAGGRKVREIIKGTYLTLTDLLGMYGSSAKGNLLAINVPLTEAVIEKLWFTNGLNAYAHPAYDKGKFWDRRISVVREHWRRTFQLQRPWLDRVKLMQPFRVAIEDSESGARAPALVFQDYTMVFSWDPNLAGIQASEQERRLAQSKYSNPDAEGKGGLIVGSPLSSLRNAPATVRILDNDQGIMQISFRDDWTGWTDRFERTATVPLGNPLGNPTSDMDRRKILMDDEEASAEHEVSIVMSFAMGAPNDDRRFHKVEVTPRQAGGLLPRNLRTEDAEGPVLTIKYGAPRGVARFPWRDDKATQFQQLFSAGWQGAFPDIGSPLNQGQLETIAQGLAARELARFANHPEGAQVRNFDPEARITGAISAVEHDFEDGPGGGAFTQIELDPAPAPIDPKARMPDDVRRMIEGFVDP